MAENKEKHHQSTSPDILVASLQTCKLLFVTFSGEHTDLLRSTFVILIIGGRWSRISGSYATFLCLTSELNDWTENHRLSDVRHAAEEAKCKQHQEDEEKMKRHDKRVTLAA